jgi:N-methylhydantoinase B
MSNVAPGSLEVIWQRLLAILEEASWTIVRTSLSPTVRESYDFGCLVYDTCGRLVAQNTTVAAKIGVYHTVLEKLLRFYPLDTLRPGDVFISNDPWLTEGHLYDVSVIKPVFRHGHVVAFVECIAHMADIGGALSTVNTDLFSEGLQIPICRLVAAGEECADIFRLIAENVRVPDVVLADIRSLLSCLFVIDEKVGALLGEYSLANFADIFEEILRRTERALRRGIRDSFVPGTYRAEVVADSDREEGNRIVVRATVADDSVVLDFEGTSAQAKAGINSCFNYTYAWSVFATRIMTGIDIPNNAGCFAPVVVAAPAGSVINPTRPAPVRNRAATAHFVPQVICAALAQATTRRAIAESGSPLWVHRVSGHDAAGKPIAGMMTFNGGMGARTGSDGPDATSFPTNARNTPVELLEMTLPIRFDEKVLIAESAGRGQWRGGCGQRVAFEVLPGATLKILYMHERTRHAAHGVRGGEPGKTGRATLNGSLLPPHGEMELRGGDRVALETPGGGGLGPTETRAPNATAADAKAGLMSRAGSIQ